MFSLLCKPVVLPTAVVSVKQCRIVKVVQKNNENIYELKILEAPPIEINPQYKRGKRSSETFPHRYLPDVAVIERVY